MPRESRGAPSAPHSTGRRRGVRGEVSVTVWGKEALSYRPGLASLHFGSLCGFCL